MCNSCVFHVSFLIMYLLFFKSFTDFFFLFIRRPPRSTLTDPLFPYTTLFRSGAALLCIGLGATRRQGPSQRSPALVEQSVCHSLYRKRGQHSTRRTPGRRLESMGRPARPESHERTRPGSGACGRSEAHTSELQSLMRNSYAVICLKKKTT